MTSLICLRTGILSESSEHSFITAVNVLASCESNSLSQITSRVGAGSNCNIPQGLIREDKEEDKQLRPSPVLNTHPQTTV